MRAAGRTCVPRPLTVWVRDTRAAQVPYQDSACARPLTRRPGWALLAACAVTLAAGTQPWLSPVGTAVRQLVGVDPSPWWLVRDTLIGVMLCGLAVVLTTAAGPRRS